MTVTSSHHSHSHAHDIDVQSPIAEEEKQQRELNSDIERLRLFLVAHFGEVSTPLLEEIEGREEELLVMTVRLDEQQAKIDLMTMVSAKLPSIRTILISTYDADGIVTEFELAAASCIRA